MLQDSRRPTRLGRANPHTFGFCRGSAGRPELQLRGLRLAGIGAGHVDDQSIRVRLHIGGCGHATALLFKFAIVKIELPGIILRLRQSGEAGNHNHSRRQTIGQRVGTIELRREAVRRPDSDTQPSVA